MRKTILLPVFGMSLALCASGQAKPSARAAQHPPTVGGNAYERLYSDSSTGVSFIYPLSWAVGSTRYGSMYGDALMPDARLTLPRAEIHFPGSRAGAGVYAGTVLRALVFGYTEAPATDAAACVALFHAEEYAPKLATIGGRKFQEFSYVNDGACHEQSDTVDVTYTAGKCLAFEREINTSCYDPASLQTGRQLTPAEQRQLHAQLASIMRSVRISKSATH